MKRSESGQVVIEYILMLVVVIVTFVILKSFLQPSITNAVQKIDQLLRSKLAGQALYTLPWK